MEEKQRRRKQWSDEERQLLVQVADQNTVAGKINWDKVAEQFQNRTRQQCKSYYQNIIKSDLQMQTRRNHVWCLPEVFRLMACVDIYGKKWEQIAQEHFEGYNSAQLETKYINHVKYEALVRQVIGKVVNNQLA